QGSEQSKGHQEPQEFVADKLKSKRAGALENPRTQLQQLVISEQRPQLASKLLFWIRCQGVKGQGLRLKNNTLSLPHHVQRDVHVVQYGSMRKLRNQLGPDGIQGARGSHTRPGQAFP